MKNTILAIAFCFSSINSFAQKQFSGLWVSEESSYVSAIIASEYAVLKVINISFSEDSVIEEEIISQTDDEFLTKIYNETNGYEAFIEYSLSEDTLICKYSGDYNGTIKLIKIDTSYAANKEQ